MREKNKTKYKKGVTKLTGNKKVSPEHLILKSI